MTTLIVLGVAVAWPLGIWFIFRAGDRETVGKRR